MGSEQCTHKKLQRLDVCCGFGTLGSKCPPTQTLIVAPAILHAPTLNSSISAGFRYSLPNTPEHRMAFSLMVVMLLQVPEEVAKQLGQANMLYASAKYKEAAELLMGVIKVWRCLGHKVYISCCIHTVQSLSSRKAVLGSVGDDQS